MNEPTCIDLRPWADAHRYRWRYEEAHTSAEADAQWFVEVLCRYGLIYPKGGNTLLAHASRGVKRQIAELAGVEHHQYDDGAEVFRFPVERLSDVAAILKPKRLAGSAMLTAEQLANLQEGRKRLEKQRQESPGMRQDGLNTQTDTDPATQRIIVVFADFAQPNRPTGVT